MGFINNIIRNKSLVSNLVFCITALLLFACSSGGSDSSGSSSGGSMGSIAFTLEIQDNLVASNRQIDAADLTSDGLTARNTLLPAQTPDEGIDCEAHQLGDIEAYVSDEEGIVIAEGGPWPCDKHEGTIKGVPAGDYRKLVIMATDKDSGEYVYRGEMGSPGDPITVLPGKTTQVGKIILDPMEPPNAPVEFEASDGQFTDSIQLSWQDVKHEDGYKIYRLIPDSATEEIDDISMDTTVYLVSGLPCTPYNELPILYYYMIRAYNDAGESLDSYVDSGFTDDCPIVKPDPPFNLNASVGESPDQILLTWEWSGDGPLYGFRVFRSESPEGPWDERIEIADAEQRNYLDSVTCTPYGAAPVLYYYIVRAYNSAGPSEEPELASEYAADCPINPPVAPFSLNATDGEYPDQILLTWDWNGEGPLTGFRIYRSKESAPNWDNYFYKQIDDSTSRSYQDLDVTCGGEWWNYMVRAYNGAGESGDSGSDSGETKICAPKNVEVTLGVNLVSLSWDETPNATTYTVYWSSPTGDSGTFPGIASTTFEHSNVDTKRNYYEVTAVSGSVESDKSEKVSAFPWLVSTIDSEVGVETQVGINTSIALDSDNMVHISYFIPGNGVMYATNASGSWSTEPVDSDGYGFTSIALDSENVAHISYVGYAGADVLYRAYKGGESGSWLYNVAYNGSSVLERNTSIEIDTNGEVHISCIISTDWDYILHVYQLSDGWSNDGVGIGQFASLALDRDNLSHISYYDYVSGVLKYGINNSTDPNPWSTSDVDTGTQVGEHSSIALDLNDKVHISYHDDTNNGLKYATNTEGGWDIVSLEATGPIEGIGEVGIDTSIAADPSLKAHISYHDAQQGILKYATNVTGEWDWESVDYSLGLRAYSSIALDALYNVHISYYDGMRQDLKYATKAIR